MFLRRFLRAFSFVHDAKIHRGFGVETRRSHDFSVFLQLFSKFSDYLQISPNVLEEIAAVMRGKRTKKTYCLAKITQ